MNEPIRSVAGGDGILMEAEALLLECGPPDDTNDGEGTFVLPLTLVAQLTSMLLSYACYYEDYEPHDTSTILMYIEEQANLSQIQ